MIRPTHKRTSSRSAHRGTLGPGLGLLLVAPMTFVLLSMAALALAGCSAVALFLPAFLRHRLERPRPDEDCIVLGSDQYSRVDDERVQLPHS